MTGDIVTVPVQLSKPFDIQAQVYGAQFTIRYLRDQFVFQSLTPDAGVTLVGTPVPATDPTNSKYELLSIHIQNSTPITNINNLVHINWEYVVAKDSLTDFQVQDLMFLDQSGASVCWVQPNMIPGQFYGNNVCGDYTIRTYLRTGQSAFSIKSIVPNPVTTAAHIDFEVAADNMPITIEVFNALGQKVQTIMSGELCNKGAYSRDVDATNFNNGIYTLRISTPGYEATKSVVVIK